MPGSADVLAAHWGETRGSEAGQLDPHRGGLLRRSGYHECLPLHLASAAAPACRAHAVLGPRIVAHHELGLAERAFLIGMRLPVEHAAGLADLERDELHRDARVACDLTDAHHPPARDLGRAARVGRHGLGEEADDLVAHLVEVDPERLKDAGCDALAFAHKPQEEMLGADVVMVPAAGLVDGELDDPFRPGG